MRAVRVLFLREGALELMIASINGSKMPDVGLEAGFDAGILQSA